MKTVTMNMTRNDIHGLKYKVKIATLITIVTTNTTYANNSIRTTFVFLNWISKYVAVAPSTILFPEESTTNNARIGFRTENFRCEHPAGACCLGSNGIRTTTAHTKTVCQLDFRTEYRTVWLIPGTRLAYWVDIPHQNNKRSFWMNRRTQLVLPRLPTFFASSCV